MIPREAHSIDECFPRSMDLHPPQTAAAVCSMIVNIVFNNLGHAIENTSTVRFLVVLYG